VAEVRWTPQAADDLDAVCSFIARDSDRLAASFAIRVLNAIERLQANPRLGRAVPELRNPEIRELIVGSYRVIYRLDVDTPQILTIHHAARLLGDAL
jgi:toxin ParE1/3/4